MTTEMVMVTTTMIMVMIIMMVMMMMMMMMDDDDDNDDNATESNTVDIANDNNKVYIFKDDLSLSRRLLTTLLISSIISKTIFTVIQWRPFITRFIIANIL